MKFLRAAAMVTLLFAAGCDDASTVAPTGLTPQMAKKTGPAVTPTGERINGNAALIPIYDQTSGEIMYGNTPAGPAIWPAHANARAQTTFYLVVYPIGTSVAPIQCYDVPQETCPDHGPVIAGGAMQLNPAVYGNGVLGHNHLSPPHGKDFHVTEYPVLVLFTSMAAANQELKTKAAVEAAAARGEVFMVPFTDFSFVNALISGAVYDHANPWICPAYTLCAP